MVEVYQRVAVAVLCCFVLGGGVCPDCRGDDEAPAAQEDALERLKTVRAALDGAKEAVKKANRDMVQYKHDVCFTNEPVAALYKEILGLEKVISDKRRKLNGEIAKYPEMRELTRKYEAAYLRLKALRDKERTLLDKLRAKQGIKR